MLIQRETPAQIAAIHAVTAAAFQHPDHPGEPPAEATLVDQLRADAAWLPALSLVAVDAGAVVGHVVCTRARIGRARALGLGPLSVHPDHQRRGVGSALVHAVLGAADALDEPIVVLLGSRAYYTRFGFRLAGELGITPPVPQWEPHFQARTLTTFTPALHGPFAYAEPFNRM
ncbi:N-acetyltransferase [Dactylosporangium sp. NPDC005572]|uniref:GNAT family N-acetyltransferase n=1 Tax=Dactylosporangium sp. NPDC005572 TaxID=3156889 RepID=UPI0033AA8034